MSRKHVVFISLPMSGIPDDMVREHIEEAKAAYLRETGRTIENTAFVDTMDNPDPPEWLPAERYGVWYLGHSLTKLASVDECFFLSWMEQSTWLHLRKGSLPALWHSSVGHGGVIESAN